MAIKDSPKDMGNLGKWYPEYILTTMINFSLIFDLYVQPPIAT